MNSFNLLKGFIIILILGFLITFSILTAYNFHAKAENPQQYKYLVLHFSLRNESALLEKWLNARGQESWELVQITAVDKIGGNPIILVIMRKNT